MNCEAGFLLIISNSSFLISNKKTLPVGDEEGLTFTQKKFDSGASYLNPRRNIPPWGDDENDEQLGQRFRKIVSQKSSWRQTV